MTAARANAFADLSDFQPRPASAKRAREEALRKDIDRLAQESGFPSRQPQQPGAASATPRRRYTTGRNQQINVKATPETIAKLYRLADERRVVLGELLELALEALENSKGA